MIVEGRPPVLYMAGLNHRQMRDSYFNKDSPTEFIPIQKITFVREFVVPGDDHAPNIATYRREPITTKAQRSQGTS